MKKTNTKTKTKTKKQIKTKKNSTIKKCNYLDKCIKDNKNITSQYLQSLKKDTIKNKSQIEYINKLLSSPKYIKDIVENCNNTFCNPSCKNTLFEEGPIITEYYLKKYKNNPKKLEEVKLLREKLYGTDTTILNNNFYKKLKNDFIKEIQKQNAISGCTMFSSNTIFANK